MNAKSLKKKSGTDWEKISKMKDTQIDLSDIPELKDSFFANAVLRMPEPKRSVSIRIDKDVLDWYKHLGSGYQTKMNAVLKMYMQSKSGVSRVKTSRPSGGRGKMKVASQE